MLKNKGSIHENLYNFLLKIRTIPQETTEKTPSLLLQGREMRSKVDAVGPDRAKRMIAEKEVDDERKIAIEKAVLVKDFKGNKGEK